MLDLKQLAQDLIKNKVHCDPSETAEDNAVIDAINQHHQDPEDRKKSLLRWLNRYSVLRGLPTEGRAAIAGQIVAFADERQQRSLQRDKGEIVSEFNKLENRISTVTKRQVHSLASKALWCCYPDDVPMFDRNAICALRLISRLCYFTPAPNQSEYECFVEIWLRVYNEIESVITPEDLSDCPYKVRVLDRLLWYLGQNSFYNDTDDSRPS